MNEHGPLLRRLGLTPDAIYRRSFATIDHLLPANARWTPDERAVARRIIHASGDASLADTLTFSPGAVTAGVAALRAGAPIVCDTRMVAAGLSERLLRASGCAVSVLIARPGLEGLARAAGITRSAAAVGAALPELAGAVVAIGSAPTALLALLDALDAGACAPPALIVGMPVGFVATPEAKAALIERPYPAISIRGTRGGSAAAAATVNALLALAAGVPSEGLTEERAP